MLLCFRDMISGNLRNEETWVLGENNIIITRPTNCSSLRLLSIIPEVVNGHVIKASTIQFNSIYVFAS